MSTEPEPETGFAQTYGVELLCKKPPEIRKKALLQAIRKYCPAVAPLDGEEQSDLLAFIHPDHPVVFEEGMLPAQSFIGTTDEPFEVTESLSAAIGQSWNFPEVREAVAQCSASVLVTDLMSSPLEYAERLKLFQDVLAGVLEVIPALAIHWQPTRQIVDPQQYRDAHMRGKSEIFYTGALNVRFFNVSESPGDMLMDTLGLAALGLPDLQCHFRGLAPEEVAPVLYNTAYYIFERGDVIEDGHTVEGVTPGERWRCQHEPSLVEPRRIVLDLDPGPSHAAGNRKNK